MTDMTRPPSIIPAKVGFLRYTLRRTSPKSHEDLINLFLSLLAIDNISDWITRELIDELEKLYIEFPGDFLKDAIDELNRQLNYERL
jgi:hypothetical protein